MAKKNKNKSFETSKVETKKVETKEVETKEENKLDKKYTVLVSVLGGKFNKIFNHKDQVTASQLNGSIEELIEKGFIK